MELLPVLWAEILDADARPMTEYDDPTLQLGWELFWEGHRHGKGVENRSEITKRTAKTKFEKYLEVNHDRDAPD